MCNSVVISNSSFKSKETCSRLEVVTVWYNREDYVKDSIDSLIEQTANNYSILAVDDGSTDKTGEYLENALLTADEADVPMRVWKKKNEGFVRSIKKAIENKSCADIIALHGAGDLSLPRRLETQIRLLESDDRIIATGVRVEKVGPDLDSISIRDVDKWPTVDIKKGIVPRLGTHGAAMFYRDTYTQAGGYRVPFMYAQDTDLLVRLINHGKFRNSEEILYQKLVTEFTVSSNSDWKQSIDQIMYSAAAMESARHRNKGLVDPIENHSSSNIEELSKIARIGGLHDRAVHRISVLILSELRSGNFVPLIVLLVRFRYKDSLRIIQHSLLNVYNKRNEIKEQIRRN